ncbi:MAG: four helix bundle protein [Bacteroidetes bacterium]|nr:four helix bundle protein [Bacteroidota bacterium]
MERLKVEDWKIESCNKQIKAKYMVKIAQFEDLEIWQKSMDLAVKAYHLTKKGNFKLEYSIQD